MKKVFFVMLLLVPIFAMYMFATGIKAKADIRSRYMDLGDKYLDIAENKCWNYESKQANAIMALAAYTAAQKE